MNIGDVLEIGLLVILFLAIAAVSGRIQGRSGSAESLRLARLERKLDRILALLGLEVEPPEDGLKEVLQGGQKIEAIRLYREQHPVGLKDAVERIQAGL